ncbi:hypothetical protein B0T14DRAFT_499895 [Immersiella caudata]|uniref:DUF1996 domain-containing protein n=1 Tax=Immersiella caudata TaxID=314043 RepID=A0AA39WFX6_9PEZI|nr:hypothetical protein B0T14DRAFT_499895 [Immersiella caudata]
MLLTSILALAAIVEAAPSDGGSPEWLKNTLAKRQGGGTTMLRFGCSNIVIDRIDPLVNPGQAPTGHIHQIVGGDNFNVSMTTGDVATGAKCTSCQASEDFSNYWTANLYFKHKNGSFKRVPQGGAAYQFNDRFSTQTQGGILVYYVSAQPGKITAFRPGFRMLSGDPMQRTADPTMRRQNCYRCYTGPNFQGDVGAPCQDAANDHPGLPEKACAGGIRTNVHFPTCWDGKNLDTPNHKDHVAYPVNGPATFLSLGGNCPSTHPVRIPQLMLEVVWDTTKFNDKSTWPDGVKQPFYLSTGDNTGYGQHADYVFGWASDSLQRAMDATNCFGPSCGRDFKRQTIDQALSCRVSAKVKEDYDQWFTHLPGVETA